MAIVELWSLMGLATFGLWAAIPVGFAMKIHPTLIGITSATGAILGVVVVVSLGDRFRHRFLKWHSKSNDTGQEASKSSRRETIDRIWQRWGIIGLGLLAPLITGAPLGAALGIVLGASTGRLIVWMSIGIVLWSAILTTVGTLGLAGIKLLQ